ncbi:MAG: E3 binding domain-containing protein [Caldilineaceae bacterium]
MDGRRRTEDELLSLVVRRPSSSPPARKGTPRLHQPRRRRIAAEHNLDRSQITGSGLHGRITKKDVLKEIGDWGLGTGDRGRGLVTGAIAADLIAQSPNPSIAQSDRQSPVPSPQSPLPHAPPSPDTWRAACALRPTSPRSTKWT